MKNIVIVGAGFGGLQVALNLEKKNSAGGGSAFGGKNGKNISLTIIDKHDYHLFTPNLYEVASSEEELVSLGKIQQTITLPIEQILKNKKIKFLKGQVNFVDPEKKQLLVDGKQLGFDYLVLALGSQSDFFGIEGAQKHAMVLKNLPDALRIRNQIEFAIQAHKFDVNKKTLRLVIAGGGYTGLEFAGSLNALVNVLAWKNNYPRHKIEIEIIEAGRELISGFDSRMSEDAYGRMQELGIHVRLSSRISGVSEHFVELMTGEKISYDCLVWTAGIKACSVTCSLPMSLDFKCRIVVNGFLQSEKFHNIFALGDMACILGQDGRPVPGTAQDAWDQAKYLANALPYFLVNQKPPQPYKNTPHGFVVRIGGKWAIMSHNGLYFKGFLAYLGDLYAHFRYYYSLVGFWAAIKSVKLQDEIYSRND